MKTIKNKITADAEKYYGYKPNIVQVYPDPKVDDCYVVRVEGGEMDNWCFVVNYGYGDDIDDAMIEDCVDLEPGQKINKGMFGELKFF